MFNESTYRQIIEHLSEGVYVVDRDRRILYWNQAAEQISGFKARDVVGRCCHENILMHCDDAGTCLCREGCPLLASMEDGGTRLGQFYLRHRRGHRVQVNVSAIPIRDLRGDVVAAVEIFSEGHEVQAMRDRIARLLHEAMGDTLTDLPNRRFLDRELAARAEDQDAGFGTVGVVLMDIDHFKSVNDRFGHDGGDAALVVVGETLKASLRSRNAVVGRWGGEEFLAVIHPVQSETLVEAAERARAMVQRSHVLHGRRTIPITLSAGVALRRDGEPVEELLARADEALYESKAAGRNRVTQAA